MRVHELRCFGASAGKGNVAMVVEDGPDQTAERQAFAVAQGRTSVFLTGTAQIEADFYYPHARSPLCLHATLAAAHVLRERGGPAQLTTAMRGQRIDLLSTGGSTFSRRAAPGGRTARHRSRPAKRSCWAKRRCNWPRRRCWHRWEVPNY
ncbi:PhzF family phenazine biosynthesis protein [Massilia sp. B-10]|nr:PhzF family phenazine biosynthesis protein [Massilia sp. B-10]